MSKVRITQAEQLVGKSRATIYRDIEKGLVSADVDERGFKVIEVSELERYYGKLKMPVETQCESQVDEMKQDETQVTTADESLLVVEVLRDQVSLLTSQLETAAERETQLLQLLVTEQEKTKLLMLPAPRPKFLGWIQERFGRGSQSAEKETLTPQEDRIVQ